LPLYARATASLFQLDLSGGSFSVNGWTIGRALLLTDETLLV
jgi:hypothetical protein